MPCAENDGQQRRIPPHSWRCAEKRNAFADSDQLGPHFASATPPSGRPLVLLDLARDDGGAISPALMGVALISRRALDRLALNEVVGV
jgi:hypothetical protein